MANWLADFLTRNPEYNSRPIVGRAARAVHFRMPGGGMAAFLTGAPMHYLEAGEWRPIDTALRVMGDGRYGAPGCPGLLSLAGVVESPVHTHRTTRAGLFNPQQRRFVALAEFSPGLLDDDRIVRDGGDYILSTILREMGIREELAVYHRPAGDTGDWLVIESEIDIELPEGELARGGWRFPPPRAWDGDGRPLPARRWADGASLLYTGVPLDALAGASLPIMIDPDIVSDVEDALINGTNSTYSIARSTSASFSTTGTFFYAGQSFLSGNYNVYRDFLLFDCASIPGGATIQQVNLTLTCIYNYSDTDFDVQIVDMNSAAYTWPVNSANCEAYYDDCLAGPLDAVWRNTAGVPLNTPYTSPNLSTAHIVPGLPALYGLRSNRDFNAIMPTAREYINPASANHGTPTYRPILTVLYQEGGTTYPASASLLGRAVATASSRALRYATASLVVHVFLTANALATRRTSAALVAHGVVSANALRSRRAAVSLAATAAMTANAVKTGGSAYPASAALTARAVLSASSQAVRRASASLAAHAFLTPAAVRLHLGTAFLLARATVAGVAARVRLGSTSILARATLTAASRALRYASSALVARGHLAAQAARALLATAALTVTAQMHCRPAVEATWFESPLCAHVEGWPSLSIAPALSLVLESPLTVRIEDGGMQSEIES